MKMTIEDWRRCSPPMFRPRPRGDEPFDPRAAAEGLSLPDVDALFRGALPLERLRPLVEETVSWLGRAIRPEWLADRLADRLLAVRAAVDGRDAFVGAWDVRGPVRVAVTRERVHLVVRIPDPGADVGASALAAANEILRLPAKPDPAKWQVRPFADVYFGIQDVAFARTWADTLFLLTDGMTVKFSLKKMDDRPSPPMSDRPAPDPGPWFPARI
ncbi:MAG: hypothetical protein HYY17_11585 [Planctomycetes bacterium]|nr:hypothetical protein [Planctomycetota bacterium]